MREAAVKNRDILYRFEDYSTFMQALGLGYEIIIDNGTAKFKMYMDDGYDIKIMNLNFPNLPPRVGNEELTFKSVVFNIVPYLKEQRPSEEFGDRFKNRWEELETLVKDTVGFNRYKDSK